MFPVYRQYEMSRDGQRCFASRPPAYAWVTLFIVCVHFCNIFPATASCKETESIHRSTSIHTLGKRKYETGSWQALLCFRPHSLTTSSSLRWVMVIVITMTMCVRTEIVFPLVCILFLHLYSARRHTYTFNSNMVNNNIISTYARSSFRHL